jgi:hypothetical protein
MKRLGGSKLEIQGGLLRDEAVELFRQWMTTPGRRVY